MARASGCSGAPCHDGRGANAVSRLLPGPSRARAQDMRIYTERLSDADILALAQDARYKVLKKEKNVKSRSKTNIVLNFVYVVYVMKTTYTAYMT